MTTNTHSFHPAVENILRWLRQIDHLPPHLKDVARSFRDVGVDMATTFDGPEVGAGLRKLVEAKDCFVRAAVDQLGDGTERVTGVAVQDSQR